MNPINQEAPCKLDNTFFEASDRRMVAGNKKGVGLILPTP
jgi:hypothetical protein